MVPAGPFMAENDSSWVGLNYGAVLQTGISFFYHELGPKVISSPPSTYKICPVTKSDAADAR